LIYQLEDVTERERTQGQLAYLIDHDALTGLVNRHRFEQELDQALARHARSGEGGAALMIDLDGFKAINDEFGHAIGDQLLRQVASVLRERCRAADVLARLSGDEFAIVVPGASRSDAARVADAFIAVIAAHPIAVGDEQARVSVSIGIAMFDGQAGPEMLSLADAAMYAAKQQGRNRFVMFDPADPNSRASGSLAEAAQLRRALRQENFVLHCQPIVSLTDNRVVQYELLIRMRGDEADELVSPRRSSTRRSDSD
jgi:diguanylate cyclase (GGDEF)-like protein